jgi:O-antigen/teichoic acid export membrane protein
MAEPKAAPAGEAWTRSLGSYYVVDLLGLVGFVALTPALIAHFGAAQFGVIALAQGLVGYLGLLDLGIKPALTRMVATAWARGEEERARELLTSGAAVLAVAAVAALGASLWIAAGLKPGSAGLSGADAAAVAPFVALKGLEFAVSLLLSPFESANYGMDRVVRMNAIRGAARILELAAGLAAILLDWPLWSLAAWGIASSLVGGALQAATLRERMVGYFPRLAELRWSATQELFRFGAFYLVNGMVVVLVFKTDELVIASALGLASVALYAPLNQAMRAVLSVVTRITAASGARPTILVARAEKEAAATLFVESLERTLTAALIMALPMAAVGAALGSAWLGKPVSDALVWALTGIMVAHIPVAVASRYLGAAGLVRSVTVVSVLEAVLNLGLSLLLVRQFGLAGVAIGTFAAQLLTTSWFNLRVACDHLGLSSARVARNALVAAARRSWPLLLLSAAAVWLVRSGLVEVVWVSAPLVAAAACLVVADWMARERRAAPSDLSSEQGASRA